jgi:hypothetical protein
MSDEDELTPADRELEFSLRSLRPMPAHVKSIVAAATARRRAATLRWRAIRIAAALAAIAMGGVVWLTMRPPELSVERVDHSALLPRTRVLSSDASQELPTLMVYRRALAHSPATLEALLDQQAAYGAAQKRRVTHVGSTLWNASLNTELGEM